MPEVDAPRLRRVLAELCSASPTTLCRESGRIQDPKGEKAGRVLWTRSQAPGARPIRAGAVRSPSDPEATMTIHSALQEPVTTR